MANTVIQLKHSTVTSNVPSSLANGEISINSRDGKFFYSTPAGSVITHYPYLGPAGLNKEIQFNDSGTLGSNSGLSFDKANGELTVSNTLILSGRDLGVYTNAAFTSANGKVKFSTSPTAPTSPQIGDIWYYTTNDVLYEYLSDGTNQYWFDMQTPTLSANTSEVNPASVRVIANAAYDQANTAIVNAGAASSYANSAYAQANTATPAWTSAGAITLTATTTNPTKGTVTTDNISYRKLGTKEWEVVMTYIQSSGTGGANGSGDYLITLPNGLSFDTTLPSQPTYTSDVGSNTFSHLPYVIPNCNGTITNNTVGGQIFPMVYSATKFRILTLTYGTGIQPWGSGFYSATDIPKIQLTFRFTST
jgi:hypothetical protein